MKKISVYASIILCVFLCAACDNFFAKPETPAGVSLPEGYGNVKISFTGEGSRTIFPSKLFDNYVYTFTKDNSAEGVEKTSVDGGFTLEAGNWHVDIKAYVGEIDTANLAASGEADFQLTENEFKEISVDFEAAATDGNGIFKYNIRYAPSTTVTSFTLKKLPEQTEVSLDYTAGSTSLTGTVESVASGFYLLNIQLAKDGRATGTSEIVHIYPLLTSEYGTKENPIIFGNSYFVPSPEGIYVGIIRFSNKVIDLTNATPVLLNEAGKNNLIDLLSDGYVRSESIGTALFYGIHTALANMKNTEPTFPDNIDSLNMVTFTDGLDRTSSGLSEPNPLEGITIVTNPAYGDYIRDEIPRRRIADKPISAYSVGIKTDDADDEIQFATTLRNIASEGDYSPGNPYWTNITNIEELKPVFEAIAGNLNQAHSTYDFIMTTTILDLGTKVRMTFDSDMPEKPTAEDGAASDKYIEGTIYRKLVDGKWYVELTDIVYKGIVTSDAGTGPLVAVVDNDKSVATYTFKNIIGFIPNLETRFVKQFTLPPGAPRWSPETEYDNTDSGDAYVDKSSSLIYLVLDNSRSLSEDDITQVREVGIQFINTLYDNYNGITTTPLSSGKWTNGTITQTTTLSQYSMEVVKGTTYRIWWNDSYQGNGTQTLNVKVSAQYQNGNSIFSNIDSGFDTAPFFTPANNGTVIIKVAPYIAETIGNYSIAYTTSNSKPDLPVTNLVSNVWSTGTIAGASQIDVYKMNVIGGTTYYIWWDDNRQGSGAETGDIEVSAYYSNGSTIFGYTDSGWEGTKEVKIQSFTPTTSGTVTVRVRSYAADASHIGTYGLVYSTSDTRPEL